MNIIAIIISLYLLFSLGCSDKNGSELSYLNLSFDRAETISPWDANNNPYYEISTDQNCVSNGTQSLCIKYIGEDSLFSEELYSLVSNEIILPKTTNLKTDISISIDIKCQDITHGVVDVRTELLSQYDEALVEVSLAKQQQIKGSSDWKTYNLFLTSDSNAKSIYLTCSLVGTGTVWFDNVIVIYGGTNYKGANLPSIINTTDSEKIELLKRIVPVENLIRDTGLLYQNFPKIFNDYVNNCKVIALGESTHGTHEFFQVKSNIIKHLISTCGVTNVALEANVGVADAINDYVQGGIGNAKILLKDIGIWCWQTNEMVDLIEWIKTHNKSSVNKVQFLGTDMQFVESTIKCINKLLEIHIKPTNVPVGTIYKDFIGIWTRLQKGDKGVNFMMLPILADSAHALISEYSGRQSKYRIDSAIIKRLLFLSNSVRQFCELFTTNDVSGTRDSLMAQNLIEQLNEKGGDTKAIIWAHNIHVNKTDKTMGGHLKKMYTKKYYAIGLLFHKGNYNGWVNGEVKVNQAISSYPGSFEYFCYSLSNTPFFLDIQPNKDTSNIPKDFFSFKDHRNVGLTAMKYSFYKKIVPGLYDAIIFVPESTPSYLIEKSNQ